MEDGPVFKEGGYYYELTYLSKVVIHHDDCEGLAEGYKEDGFVGPFETNELALKEGFKRLKERQSN